MIFNYFTNGENKAQGDHSAVSVRDVTRILSQLILHMLILLSGTTPSPILTFFIQLIPHHPSFLSTNVPSSAEQTFSDPLNLDQTPLPLFSQLPLLFHKGIL